MQDTTANQLLRAEYSMYIDLWKQARLTDGPTSRLARFFRRLAMQVASELKLYHPLAIS